MDTYRVTGSLVYPGGPRRLVDILNSVDVSYVVVRDGEMDDPWSTDSRAERFITIQVHLDTILVAIPRGNDVQQRDQMETVPKVPAESVIAVPNYEISGKVHLLPEFSPETAQLLGGRHFLPVTDAEVTAVLNKSVTWREPLVVVNLARAVLFAPRVDVEAA